MLLSSTNLTLRAGARRAARRTAHNARRQAQGDDSTDATVSDIDVDSLPDAGDDIDSAEVDSSSSGGSNGDEMNETHETDELEMPTVVEYAIPEENDEDEEEHVAEPAIDNTLVRLIVQPGQYAPREETCLYPLPSGNEYWEWKPLIDGTRASNAPQIQTMTDFTLSYRNAVKIVWAGILFLFGMCSVHAWHIWQRNHRSLFANHTQNNNVPVVRIGMAFYLNGKLVAIDGTSPFWMLSDLGNAWSPAVGNHTIQVKGYRRRNGKGRLMLQTSLRLAVIDSSAQAPVRAPVLAPAMVPVIAPLVAPMATPVSAPARDPLVTPAATPVIPPVVAPATAPAFLPPPAPAFLPPPAPAFLPPPAPVVFPPPAPAFLPPPAPAFIPAPAVAPAAGGPGTVPTKVPAKEPTKVPTKAPSKMPTKVPTKRPTTIPTKVPTKRSTTIPTKVPTKAPTKVPTKAPTKAPTRAPVVPCGNSSTFVVSYINSVTLSNKTLSMSGNRSLDRALQNLVSSNVNVDVQLSTCNQADKDRLCRRFAFLALLFSTGKGNQIGWYYQANECEWYGMQCKDDKVDLIYLFSSNLVGTLPDDIGLWTDLSDFSLYNNNLAGTLPSSIGAWSKLTYFSVSTNKMTGTVPKEVAKWASIQTASFHTNMFIGTMPVIGINFCPKNGTGTRLQADCAEIKCDCCNLLC
jgi:hypothetical protein